MSEIKKIFQNFPRELWFLSGAAFINFLGYMVRPFLILYLTRTHDFSISTAATLLSVVGLGGVAGSWGGGILIDRLSPKQVLIMSFLGSSALLWSVSLYHTGLILTAVVLLLLGCTQAVFRPAYDACVVKICPKEERGRAYALYVAVINVAAAVAMTVGGYCLSFMPNLLFELDGTTSICAAIWMMTLLPSQKKVIVSVNDDASIGRFEPVQEKVNEDTHVAPWRNGAFIIICLAVVLIEVVGMQEYSTFPLYMVSAYKFSTIGFGQILAIGHVLFACFMLPITTWVKRRDPTVLTSIGAMLLGLGYGLLPFKTIFSIGVLLYGVILLGQLFFYPALVSIVMSFAESSATRSGTYLGSFRTSQAIAGIVAPAVGGWIYTSLGAESLWISCGIVSAMVSGFFALKWLTPLKLEENMSKQP